MKLSQLKKKYPKAFKEYSKHRQVYDWALCTNEDIRNEWKWITDFMDKQDVIITTHYITYYKAKPCFAIAVKNTKNLILFSVTLSNKRSVAETKAIEKAFEILEGRSKK